MGIRERRELSGPVVQLSFCNLISYVGSSRYGSSCCTAMDVYQCSEPSPSANAIKLTRCNGQISKIPFSHPKSLITSRKSTDTFSPLNPANRLRQTSSMSSLACLELPNASASLPRLANRERKKACWSGVAARHPASVIGRIRPRLVSFTREGCRMSRRERVEMTSDTGVDTCEAAAQPPAPAFPDFIQFGKARDRWGVGRTGWIVTLYYTPQKCSRGMIKYVAHNPYQVSRFFVQFGPAGIYNVQSGFSPSSLI